MRPACAKNDTMLSEYMNGRINTLTLGAGSWEINDKNILKKTIYVDDEANMPELFIRKIKINSVVNIYNDIINSLKIK